MLQKAIEKARDRQERSLRALDACEASGAEASFKDHWSDFLLAHNSVFGVLAQGAKGCNASEPWYGRVKNFRRTDDLLNYLHKARNADEHGIDSVLLKQWKSTFIAAPGHKLQYQQVMHGGEPHMLMRSDAPFTRTVRPPEWTLADVRDTLHNDSFDAPWTHLGEPIGPALEPVACGRMAAAWTEKLLTEASELPARN